MLFPSLLLVSISPVKIGTAVSMITPVKRTLQNYLYAPTTYTYYIHIKCILYIIDVSGSQTVVMRGMDPLRDLLSIFIIVNIYV